MTATEHATPPPLDNPPPDDGRWAPARQPADAIANRSHDDDAERQVLGAALMDAKAVAEVAQTITGVDFYQPSHETIWGAIEALHYAGKPVDPISVADQLTNTKQLRAAGGVPYLHTLISGVVTAANAGYHAQILKRHTRKRHLQEAALRILQLADLPTEETDGAIATAAAELAQVNLLARVEAPTSTWSAIDISAVDGTTVNPELLTRADGIALLYAGRVHAVVGEPESGKSWLGLYGIAQLINAGRPAGMIDFEDEPNAVVRRLLDMGCRREDLNALFRYIRPDVALTSLETAHLERAVDGCGLVVVDGVTEAMTMHALSLSDNEDIAKFLALLPRRIASLGPAVLQVDHVVKDEESRGRYAIGGQHKLAGIDGCQFKAIVTEPFGRGKRGQANVIVDKDREGGVRQHTLGIKIAELVIDSRPMPEYPDAEVGPLHCYLNAPDPGERSSDGGFRPTVLMGRICDYLRVVDGASQNAVVEGIQGNAKAIRTGLRILIAEGYVTVIHAERNTQRHHLERHIDEDAEPPDDTEEGPLW